MNHTIFNPTGIYIQYYNAIARTLTDLGSTTAVKAPNTSSVTQTDLTILRNAIRSLAQNTLDIDEFNSHRDEEDAFDKYRMTVNDKQGFLVVPGNYTSNGQDLYEYEVDENGDPSQNALLFSSVPVLYEHFDDMMKVLKELNYIIKHVGSEYRITPNYSDAESVSLLAPAGTPMPPLHSSAPPDLPFYNKWVISWYYQAPDETVYYNFHTVISRLYFTAERRSNQNNWESLGSDHRIFCLNEIRQTTNKLGVGILEEYKEFEWFDDEAPESRTFYESVHGPDYSVPEKCSKTHDFSVPRRHIVWVVPNNLKRELPSPLILDHSENGLVYAGCEDDDFAKCSTRGNYEIRYGLGSSDNSGGARMRVYVTNLFMPDFDAYCMSRFTTQITSLGAITTVNRGSKTIRYRFSTLVRPNGVLVPMYWHFAGAESTFAQPVTGCDYQLYMLNSSTYEVSFNDRAVHVFASNGAFSRAYLKKQDEILYGYWNGVDITTQSGMPSVCTVVSPQGTAQLTYTPAAMIPTQTPEALQQIAYRLSGASGKLYGHTTVMSGNRRRGFIHRLLLDPTIEHPTVDDLSVVSEEYLVLPSENPADPSETETVTGPADAPYSSVKTVWGSDAEGHRVRELIYTVQGNSWIVNEKIIPSDRGVLVLESTTGADSDQPLTTRSDYYDNGLLKYRINPDGTWFYRYYDADERPIREFRPFGNIPLIPGADPNPAECEVIEYSYAPYAPDEVVEPGDTRVRRMIRTIRNVEIERTYQIFLNGEYRSIRCRTAGATWDAPGNLVTTQYSYTSGDWQGRHWKTLNSDGTARLTTYVNDASEGLIETVDSGVLNSDGTAIIDGTRQIVTKNSLGFTTARETVDIASGLTLDMVTYEVDFAGRPLKTVYADGSKSTTVYACCGPYKQINQAGTVTITTYTPDKKIAGREQAGVRVAYTYAPNGGVEETRTVGRDGSYLLTVNEYAQNGLLSQSRITLDPIAEGDNPPASEDAYAVTAYAEEWLGDYWTKTVTDPEGGVRIEGYDRFGNLRHVSGSAVAAETEHETLLLNGELCSRSSLIRPGGIREVTDVLTNFTGWQYKTVYPDGSYELTEFNTFNQPIKVTAADGTVRITEYNAKGEIARAGIDLDRNGTLSGDDPVTVYEYDVITRSDGGESIAVRRQTIKEQDGDDLITVSVSEQTGDGNRSWQSAFGRTSSFRRSYIDDDEERGMTETVVQPDGVSETRSYSDALLESSLHSVLGETFYSYDEFNRQESISHTEGDIDHVVVYRYDGRNQVTRLVETGGGSSRESTFIYDLNGRKIRETKPGDRTITYEYYPTGELKKVTGAGYYPQSYTYEAGRIKTLTTWQGYPNQPIVTTWYYNSFGQFDAKADAQNRVVQYVYNSFGQLVARIWARNLVTAYGYDNAGRLNSITYDDDTPAISYLYDQRGRMVQVTDAAGIRTLTYNPDNTPASENIPYVTGMSLRNGYDGLGRQITLQLYENDLSKYIVTRTYDAMSRLASLENEEGFLNYTYVTGSGNRIAEVQWLRSTPGVFLPVQSFTYDDFRRLTGISAVVNYTLDDRDQRTGTTYVGGETWKYRYDDFGQVVEAGRNNYSPYTYSYDTLGNRNTIHEPSASREYYTTNLLNQYTRIAATPSGAPNQYYDPDGNLSSRNGWTYTWNAENRLIRMINGTTKLEFAYDYLGRRFEKKVYSGTRVTKYQRFVYDGYKLIDIRDALQNNAQESSFVWQPQSLDVPVAMKYRNQWGYYYYDGNKNITRIVQKQSGNVLASYQYKPFGQTSVASGTWAAFNPFRFSSEYQDDETSMVYYNYRYYSTLMGRWINRDPIGEQGGVNLYAMLGNDLIDYWDGFGLDSISFSDVFEYDSESNTIKLRNDSATDLLEGKKPEPWLSFPTLPEDMLKPPWDRKPPRPQSRTKKVLRCVDSEFYWKFHGYESIDACRCAIANTVLGTFEYIEGGRSLWGDADIVITALGSQVAKEIVRNISRKILPIQAIYILARTQIQLSTHSNAYHQCISLECKQWEEVEVPWYSIDPMILIRIAESNDRITWI